MQLLSYMGYRYCLMLQEVIRTPTKHKTKVKSVRKDKERAIVCGHYLRHTKSLCDSTYLQNHSLLGLSCCCLCSAPVDTFICTNACESYLTHNGLFTTVLRASTRSLDCIVSKSRTTAAPLVFMCSKLSGWSPHSGKPTIGTP